MRRLIRSEYNNVVADLFGDTTRPANELPSEEFGNGFGNDANAQPISRLLAEKYEKVAAAVAKGVTESGPRIGQLAPCAAELKDASGPPRPDEAVCARQILHALLPRAYRRPVHPSEVDELLALQQDIRLDSSFGVSIAATIEAVLQTPDFLYRVELGGAPEPGRPNVSRPLPHEMASRLSFLFWGTAPDAELMAAAERGELSANQGVLAHAYRMLGDPRTKRTLRFFFDNYLPIGDLAFLERDVAPFPTFSPQIGAFMREETQLFLEHVIFHGPGSWPAAFTESYTFLNGPLAEFYGVPGVSGTQFQPVPLDTSMETKRPRLLHR